MLHVLGLALLLVFATTACDNGRDDEALHQYVSAISDWLDEVSFSSTVNWDYWSERYEPGLPWDRAGLPKVEPPPALAAAHEALMQAFLLQANANINRTQLGADVGGVARSLGWQGQYDYSKRPWERLPNLFDRYSATCERNAGDVGGSFSGSETASFSDAELDLFFSFKRACELEGQAGETRLAAERAWTATVLFACGADYDADRYYTWGRLYAPPLSDLC